MGERARRDAHREPVDGLRLGDRRDLVREVARLHEIVRGEAALGEPEHGPRRGGETVGGVARGRDRANEQRFGALFVTELDGEIDRFADLRRRCFGEPGAALEEVEQQVLIAAVARDALVHDKDLLVVGRFRRGELEQPPRLLPARLGGKRALEQLDALLAARVAADEDLGEAIQRVDLLRRRFGVGAGELEHLVERARLLGGVAERGGDARLRVERFRELFAEDLDAAIQIRGAFEIVRVGLERLAGAHEDVRDQRRIIFAAQPIDDGLDLLDEFLRRGDALRELARFVVQVEPRRHRVDRLDQRIECVGWTIQLLIERLGHVAEHARLTRRLRVGRESLLEHFEQALAFAVREQAAAQAAHAGVGLDRRLHRRFEQLFGLIVLVARGGELVELVQHLGGADGVLVIARRIAAHDEQQRAIRALRFVDLTRGARHLGELLLDRRVGRIHLRRRFHFGHRFIDLALGLRDACELDVQRGALRRAAAAEVGDQFAEQRARLDELAGDALADRERGTQILVGRVERQRGLERRDRERR